MRHRIVILMILLAVMAGLAGCGSQPPNEPRAANQTAASGSPPKKDEGGNGGHYKVNPAQSRLTAHVGVGGLLAAAGHPHTIAITDLDGDVSVNGDTLESASLRITINSGTLSEVGKEFDEKDRKKVNQAVRGEALETGKYPEIVFKGSTVSVKQFGEGRYTATIKGDLAMHGVTRQISFPVKVRQVKGSLLASGEFTILHSDYNLKRLTAGAGMVKAEDEIRVSFELQADRL